MEIVSFKIAKKLKEKGFPQRPDYFNYSSYYDWDGLRKIHSLSNASVWFDPNISRDNIYFAPTISQVLKWLREKKKIYVMIDRSFSVKNSWHYVICNNDDFEHLTQQESIPNRKWELAAIAGVEYVVDNLI